MIALAKTTKDHGKVKHINIRHHYLRELVKSEAVIFEQIPSHKKIADLFTKPLGRNHHHRFLTTDQSQCLLRVLRLWGSVER